jgi:hypothetical protein
VSPRLERHEQADGIRLLRSLGGQVYESGTIARPGSGPHRPTCQTPGIPDVEVYLPAPRFGRGLPAGQTRVLLKWEAKRPGGRLSPAQVDYQRLARAAGVHHVAGDLNALLTWLVGAGYLRADQLPHDRQPASATGVAR